MATGGMGRATLIILLIGLLSMLVSAAPGSIITQSGHSYYAQLVTYAPSNNWAGLTITHNLLTLSDSPYPFASLTLSTPVIQAVQFPGYNLKDDNHYYAAMFPSVFNLNNVQNVSPADLQAGGMFDSSHYPQFYPDYTTINDNPNITFCCNTTIIPLGGRNFTAFHVQLATNVDYYLLKYLDGGTPTPLFLTEMRDQVCYNSTACVGEFLLPKSTTQYNFYVLSKYPLYNFTVYIDGVQTNTFPQTALPYNLTAYVEDAYTGQPGANLDVIVGEDNGLNIFIPYHLSGYVSRAYSIGKTDANGWVSFIVAPTAYPAVPDENIYLGVKIRDDIISGKTVLGIAKKDSLVFQSKPLQPTGLYDNAKASVNAMNQIVSFLFKWSSQLLQAKKFTITYDISTNTFSYYDYQNGTSSILLKTGAPNVITVYLKNGASYLSGYARIREQDGYLIMNPVTDSTPLPPKQRVHDQLVPTGVEFIITPTSLGRISSNVTITILDSNKNELATTTLPVDANLNIVSGGVFYNNDYLKTLVNAMNQIVYSLFYALNY